MTVFGRRSKKIGDVLCRPIGKNARPVFHEVRFAALEIRPVAEKRKREAPDASGKGRAVGGNR